MKNSPQRWKLAAFLLTAVSAAACGSGAAGNAGAAAPEPGPRVVQPGAPGEASRQLGDGETVGSTQIRHTEADVRFMQDMIVHHAQAVEMTSLVADRSTSEDVRLLARRIEASQEDEMALMRRWLEARDEEVPDEHAHHHHHHGHGGHHAAHGDPHAGMPGMLTPEQLARLRAASGAEFDRLFLEFMIHHHEGALIMVEELFASDGAGQEVEIFTFASHVDSDQRMEIDRMRRMLHARR